jgi:hypothetical protein
MFSLKGKNAGTAKLMHILLVLRPGVVLIIESSSRGQRNLAPAAHH